MSAPGSPPPPSISPRGIVIAQMTEAVKWQTVTILASAIITASGRPYSIEQALEIVQDIQFALYPERKSDIYKEWEKTKDARLKKVRV
jgi:hypothetical protein